MSILLVGGWHDGVYVKFPDLPVGGEIRMARFAALPTDAYVSTDLPDISPMAYDSYRRRSETHAVFESTQGMPST